jgi:hypothetical protein
MLHGVELAVAEHGLWASGQAKHISRQHADMGERRMRRLWLYGKQHNW